MTAVIAMTNEDYAPRFYADRILGGRIHDYLRVELADLDVLWLIPRCQEGRSDPVKQPRLQLHEDCSPFADVCDACLSLRRRSEVEGTHEP